MSKKEKFRAVHSIDEEKIKENISKLPGGIAKNKTRYNFAIRLNSLLEKKEKEQVDFASEIDIGESTLSQYRSGLREPKISFLVRISKALNVSTDYLSGLNDYESKDESYINITKKIGLSHNAILVLEEYNFNKPNTMISTINFLLEQEKLNIIRQRLEVGVDTNSKKYEILKRRLNKKDYIPMIDVIRKYFDLSINDDKPLFINDSSFIINKDIKNVKNAITEQENMYATNTVSSKEIIDFKYFKEIEDNLKKLAPKYIDYLKNEVDNQ